MARFQVTTLKDDNSPGPIPTVTADDFENAADVALGRTDVSAAGGEIASYIREITGTEAADGGFMLETTGQNIKTATDTINGKLPTAAALSDALTNPTATIVGAALLQYNGSTLERTRGNTNLTVLASSARTETINSSDFTNYNARGLILTIDVTAIVDTPEIIVKIQGKCPVSNKYYDILTASPISDVTDPIVVLRVYPGLEASANLVANNTLPKTFRVRVEHDDTDSITYSVGASLIL